MKTKAPYGSRLDHEVLVVEELTDGHKEVSVTFIRLVSMRARWHSSPGLRLRSGWACVCLFRESCSGAVRHWPHFRVGSSLVGRGVQPDVAEPILPTALGSGQDNQLARALDIVAGN